MGSLDYFVPGEEISGFPAGFLDPLPASVVRRYLEVFVPAGGRALDPFSQTPVLSQEAALLGKDALASHFSPLHVLVIKALLNLLPPSQLDAATTRLGDAPKLGKPLREHILGLYASQCVRCRGAVIVDRFLWEGGMLKKKEYKCPHCGFQGPASPEEQDHEKAQAVQPQGFHHHYLLERVAPPGDEDRRLMRNLLETYSPRNLSALVDLSIKIDSLFADSSLLDTMKLLLLLTIANTSKFGAFGLPRFLPGRFRPPSNFEETNVWMAFEGTYQFLRQFAADKEEVASATVTQESTRALARRLEAKSLDLILTTPPPPDRNLWALYYLWTAWLLGREQASVLKPLLRVRQGDWTWYRRAMSQSLRSLAPTLRPGSRLVFLLEKGNYPWAVRLLLAASEADLKMEGLVFQPEVAPEDAKSKVTQGETYRLIFAQQEATTISAQPVSQELRHVAVQAAEEILRQWGEALPSQHLRLAIWEAWGKKDLLRPAVKEGLTAKELEQEIEEVIKEGLDAGKFFQFVIQEDIVWFGSLYKEGKPLSDRVEEAAHLLLTESASIPFLEAQEKIYAQFPSVLTPPRGLVEAALRAYGEEKDGNLQPWTEYLELSKDGILTVLEQLGQRLGFVMLRPKEPSFCDLAWREGQELAYLFIIRSHAMLNDFYVWVESTPKQARTLVVIPNALGELLRLKLAWSPILRQRLIEAGWDFVKYENLKPLATQEEIQRHDLSKIIGLLPPVEAREAQLPLLM